MGGGLVELRHGPKAEHSSRWLQVSHTFQPSVPRLDVQLDQTTVSLAFNLEGDAPTQQQVYAFLPLRSYGLCFIVQVSPSPALSMAKIPPQLSCTMNYSCRLIVQLRFLSAKRSLRWCLLNLHAGRVTRQFVQG